jgi:enediyne biosynthesis protein E4
MVPVAARSAVFGDLDNDGWVDIVVNNLDGPPQVFHNDGVNGNNSILVKLAGTEGNRDAYGARLKVTAGDLVQMDECRSGGSYISQNDKRMHFGLEKRPQVDSIEVRWPKGRSQVYTNIPANTLVTLTEGNPTPDIKALRK